MFKKTGLLYYLGWPNRPWTMFTEKKAIDIYPEFDAFFRSVNERYARQEQDQDSYVFVCDDNSDKVVNYVPGKKLVLTSGFERINVRKKIDDSLTWLSGRKITIGIEEDILSIQAYDSGEVLSVDFIGEGNSCKVPDKMERSICKFGEKACCVFLSMSPCGFLCEKFSSTARMLLDRVASQNANRRIGSCRMSGKRL